MKVRDIMTTDLQVIAPETNVADIARLAVASGAPALPVADAEGRVLGVVSQFDLVAKHARVHVPRYLGILGGIIPLDTHRTDVELRHVLAVTAADLMTPDVPSVSPDAEIDDAATIIVDEKVDALLVLENGRLAGVVTHLDIIKLLVLEETDGGNTDQG